MRPELLPAIEALKGEVADLESKVAAARSMTNRMCEIAGVPLVYADVGTSERARSDTTRADLYYGKGLNTAARELLEARNAAGRGPASPREIYDGLVAGGLQFESESEANRLDILRATLRKNSGIFHKLPNGQFGLLAWYPKVKASKSEDDAEASALSKRTASQKRAAVPSRPKPKAKRPPHTRHPAAAPESPVGSDFDAFALALLADGKGRRAAELKQKAVELGNLGVDQTTDLRSLIVRLLGLKRQGKINSEGSGVWIIAEADQAGAVIHPFKATA